MTIKNGAKELVSLLQYMKETTIENPNILVKDTRILELDEIVNEVKESEEWEAVQMSILEIGLERGEEIGKEIGIKQGKEIGIKQGKEIGIEQGIRVLIETCQEMGMLKEETQAKVEMKFALTEAVAKEFMEKYWENC